MKELESEVAKQNNEIERERKHKLKELREQKDNFQTKIQELETQIAVVKEREEASKQKF